MNTIKVWTIILGLFVAAFGAATANAEDACPSCEDVDACLAEIHELEADINLLNLINGLHLTQDQIKAILKAARRVEKDLAPLAKGPCDEPKDLKEELKILKAVRDSLVKGKKAPTTLKARYDVLEERRHKRCVGKLGPKVQEKVQESVERVQAALTPAQKDILSTYKPCLIPPKNLKDPVRVGQAKDTGPMQRYLDEVRGLPDDIYENYIDKIAANVVQESERHVGAMKEEERKRFLERVVDISNRVRKMSDVEFALEKDALAEELAPEDQAEVLRAKLADMGVARFQMEGKITHFLLNPRIIPILEDRLVRMKKGLASKAAGKETVPF